MSRRPKHSIMRVLSCVFAMSVMATGSQAQDTRSRTTSDKPLVVLIKEGGTVPAQALMAAPSTDATTIAFFNLTGGARLTKGDAGSTTGTPRDGVIFTPELAAARLGDEGYLSVAVNREKLARSIRVATVSASDFATALRLLSLAEGEVSSSNAALLDNTDDRRALGNAGAALRVAKDYLIVDYAQVDPSGWGEEGVVTPRPYGTRVTAEGAVTPQGVCFRNPFGPGLVRWESVNPFYYSVKPESSGNWLIWATAPDDDIDGIWNQFWGGGYAWKVPDHCTAHGDWGLGCCCNAAASVFGGTCRTANFSGDERSWPYWPLVR